MSIQLINGLLGSATLLKALLDELKANKGTLVVIGVGYFSGDDNLIKEFGEALRDWLAKSESRRVCIFVGDWRDVDAAPVEKNEASVRGLAVLQQVLEFDTRLQLVFIPELHAKFYSVWTKQTLEWVSIGSSNFSKSALREQNIELDLVFRSQDSCLVAIGRQLAGFIVALHGQQTDDIGLESAMTDVIDRNLEREYKIQATTLARKTLAERKEMLGAMAESDRAQGISS